MLSVRYANHHHLFRSVSRRCCYCLSGYTAFYWYLPAKKKEKENIISIHAFKCIWFFYEFCCVESKKRKGWKKAKKNIHRNTRIICLRTRMNIDQKVSIGYINIWLCVWLMTVQHWVRCFYLFVYSYRSILRSKIICYWYQFQFGWIDLYSSTMHRQWLIYIVVLRPFELKVDWWYWQRFNCLT